MKKIKKVLTNKNMYDIVIHIKQIGILYYMSNQEDIPLWE